MTKLVKLLRNLKKLKKYQKFSKYFAYSRFIPTKPITIKTVAKTNILGNFEFAFFCSSVGLILYYIHLNRKHVGETVRLISAGIATHIVVDVITYLGDKINTKVKVESFLKKKGVSSVKGIDQLFDKKFSKLAKNVKRKRNLGQGTLGFYLGDLHFRGLQAAMVFVTINSIVFYGLYKNIKHFLKESLGIQGFTNFFLSAAVAQFFAMMLAFPLENIKTRMQASNFSYDSFFMYYRKLIKGKPWNVIYDNFKNEYSGFVSHLVLYVVYESVTFSIYETMMKHNYFASKNSSASTSGKEEKEIGKREKISEHEEDHSGHEVNFSQVILASTVSGLIAAIVTNPIDVYQINKQINPKFAYNQLNRENIMLGMKERIYFITFLNICTFIFLEHIGPKYYNVRLE